MKEKDLFRFLGKRMKNIKTGFVGIVVGYTVDNHLVLRMESHTETVHVSKCREV